MSGPRSSRFSPRLVAADRLEALFCSPPRERLVQQMVEDVLATRDAGGGRYEVVVAPRGAGKSHLIALVEARLRAHPRRGDLVLATLAEEEHPSNYVDLLARMLASLPTEPGLPSPVEQVAQLRRTPRAEQEGAVERMLRARMGERPVCLVLENLDRVFRAIGEPGQQRLRALLQAAGRWSVVATSCTYREPFKGPRAPFFQMFTRVPLPEFTDEDAFQMILKLAREHGDRALEAQLLALGGRARIAAMRVLLGGNPRAMAILFPFLRHRELDDLEGTFFDLSEELTPYFQDAMSRLPEGQRSYLELLAGNWYPMSVSELADATFSTPQTASGQLRYLRMDQHVISNTVGRESFYEVAEPLYRLALCMKRPDRAPAALARFLASWLERQELEQRWTLAGGRETADNPWSLALWPRVDEGTEYERALMRELEALKERGEVEAAIEKARVSWLAHHFPLIGTWLFGQLAAVRPEEVVALADELVGCAGAAGASAVLFWVGARDLPVKPETEETAVQALIVEFEAGNRVAGWPLLLARELDGALRARCLEGVGDMPSFLVAPIVSALGTKGRLAEAWSVARRASWEAWDYSHRFEMMEWLFRLGEPVNLSDDEISAGIGGPERDAILCLARANRDDWPGALLAARRVVNAKASVSALTAAYAIFAALDLNGDAFDLLRRILAADPARTWARAAILNTLLKEGDLVGASAYVPSDLLAIPAGSELAEATLQVLVLSNRWAEALVLFDRVDPAVVAITQAFQELHSGAIPTGLAQLQPTDRVPLLRAKLLEELLRGLAQLLRGLAPSVRALLRSDVQWSATLSGVLQKLIGQRWQTTGHPALPAELRQALDLLDPDAPWLRSSDALCALPDDPRPFALLPAPERAVIRAVYAKEFPDLLAHLPPEPRLEAD